MGGASSSTFSGYIDQYVGWPVQFWYNVGFEAFLAIMCLLFLDETVWHRADTAPVPIPPAGFVQRKLATYAFTKRLTPTKPRHEVVQSITLPFIIAFCPITIFIGVTFMIFYGWGIAMNTFLSIFLEDPLDEGGYGFSPGRNASCKFNLCLLTVSKSDQHHCSYLLLLGRRWGRSNLWPLAWGPSSSRYLFPQRRGLETGISPAFTMDPSTHLSPNQHWTLWRQPVPSLELHGPRSCRFPG